MAAGGYKEFVAGETLDQDEINDFLMQGVLVFAGTAARGSAITAPVEGQFAFLKDSDALTFYDGSQWTELSTSPGAAVASGGTEVTSGGFKYHTFTGNGSLTISEAGIVELLIIGGGGAGTDADGLASQAGGGGGAGEVAFYDNLYVAAGTATIVVGGGGAGVSGRTGYGFGSRSHFLHDGSYFQGVGGAVAGTFNMSGQRAYAGASGGGGHSRDSSLGGAALSQFGSDGGNGTSAGAGGGGGGSGAAGSNGSGTTGGAGGAGTNTYSTWATATSTGVSGFYAGGGGGGGAGTGGAGGSGGGGAGTTTTNAGDATANTGSGGGGCRQGIAGDGGSGLVIVRYAV